MKTLTWSRHVGLILGVLVIALWAWCGASSLADTSQPSMKELIEKRAKERRPDQSPAEKGESAVPDDSLGRGTPRSSVRGFLAAARSRNYNDAAEYLDLRYLPGDVTPEHGPELARQLRIVIDRGLWIDLDALSASPEGDIKDDLPEGRDRVGRLTAGNKTYDLLVQRVPRADGVPIWKIAGVTVAEIPALYDEFGYGPLEKIFPAWLFDVSFLGIHLWLWLTAVCIALLMIPVVMFITWLGALILSHWWPNTAPEIARFFRGPIRLLLWAVLGRAAIQMMGTTVASRSITQAKTIILIALAWMILRSIDFGLYRLETRFVTRGLSGARVLLLPAARLLKFVAVIGVVLMWLDNLGFKVTALLAGLSISGVAVALASQKTLENIFGALTLFTAQPVKVGDFCRFGNHMGTVETIGLRSTRIRTLERSIVNISNAEFVNQHLDNLSERDRFWYHPRLELRRETRPDQIRYILVEVRKMLYAHPSIMGDPLWVRFMGFGEYSLDVDIFCYIEVKDYTESLGIAEDLNLRIMDIVAAAGTELAVPAQLEYNAPAKILDEGRMQAIEGQVKDWKSKGMLYLPNFPKEKIAEVKGSLDYPPAGSPEAVVR